MNPNNAFHRYAVSLSSLLATLGGAALWMHYQCFEDDRNLIRTTLTEGNHDTSTTHQESLKSPGIDDVIDHDEFPKEDKSKHTKVDGSGDRGDDNGGETEKSFLGQCLERQLYRPKVPYPAWDYDWDDRMTDTTSLDTLRSLGGYIESKNLFQTVYKTRHILLIRHGQYDETHQDDTLRVLTPLGRRQAAATGQRLAAWMNGTSTGQERSSGSASSTNVRDTCYIKSISMSDMTRAKETASIITQYLPSDSDNVLVVSEPDPLLNESLPAPIIPVRPDVSNQIQEVDEEHDRIERAYRKYIYRDNQIPDDDDGDDDEKEGGFMQQQQQRLTDCRSTNRHEFEVIVGHGNVIRYFACRALQIPPEAWLRFQTFNCSITYLVVYPNGYVSARMIGDTGHLSYDETTFSGNHGYNW